jgi:hypothetical protein
LEVVNDETMLAMSNPEPMPCEDTTVLGTVAGVADAVLGDDAEVEDAMGVLMSLFYRQWVRVL